MNASGSGRTRRVLPESEGHSGRVIARGGVRTRGRVLPRPGATGALLDHERQYI